MRLFSTIPILIVSLLLLNLMLNPVMSPSMNSSAWASDLVAPISRRQFIKTAAACSLASIIPAPTSSFAHHYRWGIHPESDLETFGLESFGNTAKELLLKEKYIGDEQLAEKIRWQIQDKLWDLLQPKNRTFKTTFVKAKVAIAIGKNEYLYLDPEFHLEPLASAGIKNEGRTVGKIEYLSSDKDPRMVTYWISSPPSDHHTIVINP